MSHDSSPVSIDDYFQLRFLQDAALSPSGSEVLYTLSHVETEADDGDEAEPVERRTIYLIDLASEDERPFSAGQANDHSPAWSPDGSSIAFVSDREGKAQIFEIDRHGGEARVITDLPNGVGAGPVWSPDGKNIAFTAPAQDENDPGDPYRVTRAVWRFDGIGRVDRNGQDLWIHDIETSESRRLTDDGRHYMRPSFSPDGRRILALSMLASPEIGPKAELSVVDLEGNASLVNESWGIVTTAAWSKTGDLIYFAGAPDEQLIGTQHQLWQTEADGGGVLALTPVSRPHIAGGLQPDMPSANIRTPHIFLSDDGNDLFVSAQRGGQVDIVRVDLTVQDSQPVEPEIVVTGERSCSLLGLCGDTMLVASTSLNDPGTLSVFNLSQGEERQLTRFNDEFLARKALPEILHLGFKGRDGVDVEGWLLKPTFGEPPYAGFLYIHGGPHSAYGHIFSFDFQMLAGAGYAVLVVNHRASNGYGDEFGTGIHGDWGNLDFGDLMAGVDGAIEQGLLDPERLALGGLSGGGNLTCWTIGQTNRFKAAVAENPLTNWSSFYGVSDIGVWFGVRELGGHVYEIPEVYQRCSPITYAHHCTTPTLFVQCENDWRCPAEQSEQFYTILKSTGCTTEMVRLPGGFHAGAVMGPPNLRAAQNRALLGWVEQYNPIREHARE